jgi:Family of unknown function (DUF5691)
MTLDDLTNCALVGTARLAPPVVPASDAIGQALSEIPTTSAEEKLLATAAIVTGYTACGARAPILTRNVEPAPMDDTPPCSRVAGELLRQFLGLSNTPTKQQLILLWLEGAARTRQRVPDGLLPQLLDYGAGNRSTRDAIASVVGRRGQWLMSLNSKWRYTAIVEEDPASLWSTGNREQRTAALRRLRQSDPSAARALIESTWGEDGADERAGFVEALGIDVQEADEPLLERALSDRSKQVRGAAASVSSKLPTSAFVRRMTERAAPLLRFELGSKGGLLKRATPDKVRIELPADGASPDWIRDGITEAPPHGVGKRQWLLSQIVGAVPPAEWVHRWQRTPSDIIAASVGEFGDLLLAAWAQATRRFGDAAWARALLDAFLQDNRGELDVELIRLLNVQDQRQLATTLFTLPKLDMQVLIRAIDAVPVELDIETANAVASAMQRFARGRAGEYDYQVSALIEKLAFRVPTTLYDDWSRTFSGPEWEGNRKALDQFFYLLQRRRDIQREFVS